MRERGRREKRRQQGAVSWDAASQLAYQVATEGESESNVDPLERMRLEELGRVAELRVADATGLSVSTTGRAVTIVPVTRTQWVARSLPAFRPRFESLASSLSAASSLSRWRTTEVSVSAVLSMVPRTNPRPVRRSSTCPASPFTPDPLRTCTT